MSYRPICDLWFLARCKYTLLSAAGCGMRGA